MKLPTITIGNNVIGEEHPVFIIAEAGVNHNQQLPMALHMIDEAAKAGADAIKFQTFLPDQVVRKNTPMAQYQSANTHSQKSQWELLESVYLPETFYPTLIERCKEKHILFLSTPHGGKDSVDFLEALNLPAYKISSGDLTNYLLVDYIARYKKPMILSTGIAYDDEIQKTVKRIQSLGNDNIVVMQCTTNYPCPPEEANLKVLHAFSKLHVLAGFSDHTVGDEAAIAATALGIAVYEFHFTLDKTLPGPDHIASIEPYEMKCRIQAIRKTEMLLGSGIKEPSPGAVLDSMRPLVSRSLVARRTLKKGQRIMIDDLEALRPGDGVAPSEYERFLGKIVMRSIKKHDPLQLSDVE